MGNNDPKFDGSQSLGEMLRAAGVQRAGGEPSQGIAHATAENTSSNASNTNGGNSDGGEMARGLNIPTDQGTPGRFNTMQGGQEPQRTEAPPKEPASNVPPDAKAAAEEIGKKMGEASSKTAGNLSGMLDAKKQESPAKGAEQAREAPERGR